MCCCCCFCCCNLLGRRRTHSPTKTLLRNSREEEKRKKEDKKKVYHTNKRARKTHLDERGVLGIMQSAEGTGFRGEALWKGGVETIAETGRGPLASRGGGAAVQCRWRWLVHIWLGCEGSPTDTLLRTIIILVCSLFWSKKHKFLQQLSTGREGTAVQMPPKTEVQHATHIIHPETRFTHLHATRTAQHRPGG